MVLVLGPIMVFASKVFSFKGNLQLTIVKYRFEFEFQDNNLQGQTSKVLVATLFIISSIVLSLSFSQKS
jgi:hypothetical protein